VKFQQAQRCAATARGLLKSRATANIDETVRAGYFEIGYFNFVNRAHYSDYGVLCRRNTEGSEGPLLITRMRMHPPPSSVVFGCKDSSQRNPQGNSSPPEFFNPVRTPSRISCYLPFARFLLRGKRGNEGVDLKGHIKSKFGEAMIFLSDARTRALPKALHVRVYMCLK